MEPTFYAHKIMSEQSSDDKKEVLKVLENLMKYFTSENHIPVERATILTESKEIQDIKNLVAKLKGNGYFTCIS